MKIRVRFEPMELNIPGKPDDEQVNEMLAEMFPGVDAAWEIIEESTKSQRKPKPVIVADRKKVHKKAVDARRH